MVPVVVVILATLGVILAGIATPTDAGACGAFAVLMLTLVSRTISWQKLKNAVYATLEVSCMILLLVAASNYFGAVFSRLGIGQHDRRIAAQPAAARRRSCCVLILAVIFVLGWPLEWVPIVLIVVPILLPLVQKLGIDLDLVLHAGRRLPADGVAFAAGRAIGLFSQGRRAGLEAQRHLCGMMQFMVLQVIGLAAHFVLSAARALASGRAEKLTTDDIILVCC